MGVPRTYTGGCRGGSGESVQYTGSVHRNTLGCTATGQIKDGDRVRIQRDESRKDSSPIPYWIKCRDVGTRVGPFQPGLAIWIF
jgi:hypothetical protein